MSESTNFLTQAEFLSKEKNIKIGRHFLETAEFAIMINCGPVADKALAMEILHNPSSSESHLLFAKFEAQRGRLNNAESTLKTVLDVDKTEVNALVALGEQNLMFRPCILYAKEV